MSRPDASDRPPEPSAVEHPDVDTLADFGASQLAAPVADGVRRHLDGCAECRSRLTSYDDVARLLRDLPPVRMPDDVLARLEEALREEAAGRGAEPTPVAAPSLQQPAPAMTTVGRPLGSTSRWRRWRTGRTGTGLAGLAAAAAVVLLVGGVVAGALHLRNGGDAHSQTSAGNSGGATLAAPPHTYATTHSGADYTKASLAAAIPALIGSPAGAPHAAPLYNSGSDQAVAGTAGSPAPPAPPAPTSAAGASEAKSGLTSLSVMDPLAQQPAVLFACIAALSGSRSGAVPLAVDIARFNDRPAAVIVLPSPGHPADVEAWVVGPGCGRTPGNDVLFWQRVPRA